MTADRPQSLTDVERGLVAGVLIGEGHFGGDGKTPQITLRMHVRHEALFDREGMRGPLLRAVAAAC